MGKRLIADRDLARKMKKVARFNQKKSKMDLTPFPDLAMQSSKTTISEPN